MPPELETLKLLLPDFIAACAVIIVTVLFLKHIRSSAADTRQMAESAAAAFTNALKIVTDEFARVTSASLDRLESLETEQRRTNETLARMETTCRYQPQRKELSNASHS